MKTWQKIALAVAVPGGVVIMAGLLAYRWLIRWERGYK